MRAIETTFLLLALVSPWKAAAQDLASAEQPAGQPIHYGIPEVASEGGAETKVYDPTARRDPFRPFILDLRPEGRTEELTPLQRYEVGQLTVAATVWEVNPPRALLEDGTGMGYIITLGTAIGPNGGVVTAIEPERVVVEERVLDFYGKERLNRIVMETPREETPNQSARGRK
jgi:Tfp pilus assembly protein PilP